MKSELVFVGEQPGDREDVEGPPFVGPAGRGAPTRRSSARGSFWSAGLRQNAVKHFNNNSRREARIHQRLYASRSARRRWLDAELEAIEPDSARRALGATAAQGCCSGASSA